MAFNKAVKAGIKLRMAIMGVSGSGKSYTALTFAKALGGKVAVIDTESGSASKYSDLFDFDVLNLAAPYHPDRFRAALKEAVEGGYDTLIIDSMSHEWIGPGGCLELVDEVAAKKFRGNNFAAWGVVTPIHRALVESLLAAPLNLIITMRSKQTYSEDVGENGKKTITKMGMAPLQREGMDYEMDIVLEMDVLNTAMVTKSRCPALAGKTFRFPGKEVIEIVKPWLGNWTPPVAGETWETWERPADATAWLTITHGVDAEVAKNLFREAAEKAGGWSDANAKAVFREFHRTNAVTTPALADVQERAF